MRFTATIREMFCCRRTASFTPNHIVDDAFAAPSNRRSDSINSTGSSRKSNSVIGTPAEGTAENISASAKTSTDASSSVSTTKSSATGSDVEQQTDRRGGLRGPNVDTSIAIPTYSKTNSEAESIRCALLNNEFLRGIIPDSELAKVVEAMSPLSIAANDTIIKQGEHGDQFYVSAEGTYRIIVDAEIVDTFSNQRVFGELAVLYKNPRGATIQALTAGRIWAMDGPIFQALLINSARDRQVQLLRFLRSVPSLEEAGNDKLTQIGKLMRETFYASRTTIIRQGDRGDRFFVIKVGRVRVLVDGVGQVAELGEGDFFGERALIESSDVRQATCIAEPPGVTCLELTRNEFVTYLGDFKSFISDTSSPRRSTPSHSNRIGKQHHSKDDFDAPGLADLIQVRTIGVGGFGRVVLVKAGVATGDDQLYALKMLNKAENRSKEQREHTLNEKRIQIACRSPFVVRLFCTYQNRKYLYFLMEACMGGDLFSLMQRQKGRCFDEEGAQFIAGCILEALAYLHHLNFVYRDLKPENMLIDADGYIKLADFGFAKHVTITEQTYTFAGTPEYVAPEVIYNKGHNRAVDYWAFGIFVFELLVGKTPFKTNDPSYMKTYGLILKGIENIQFPSRVPKLAVNLVKKLCKLTAHERLGCQRRGVADIRNHKWFAALNWQALNEKRIKSKFVPKLTSIDDTTHFDDFGDNFLEPEDDNEIWTDF